MKAVKLRFYPTLKQRRQLKEEFRSSKFVYNWSLAHRSKLYEEKKFSINWIGLSREITKLKKEKPFLRKTTGTVHCNTLKSLESGYQRFFRKQGKFPRFKRFKRSCTYTLDKRQSKNIFKDKTILKLPKLGKINVIWSQEVPIFPNSATVSTDSADRWFVSLQVDCKCKKEIPYTMSAVGIDLGLHCYIATSEGEKIKSPKILRKNLRKLKKKSKFLSKKKKRSNNRLKARKRLGKLHARIADKRRDFLHKLSTTIVKKHQTVAVEDLSVRRMMSNKKLSRSIGDASWSEFRRQLEYKSNWYKRDFMLANPRNTSKTCSRCGFVLNELSLNVRRWCCISCGEEHDRDINAARNILATARSAGSACGTSNKPKVAA